MVIGIDHSLLIIVIDHIFFAVIVIERSRVAVEVLNDGCVTVIVIDHKCIVTDFSWSITMVTVLEMGNVVNHFDAAGH